MIEPRLARRIDRLARRAHAFHRFAHHPLCGAYAGEVVRLGRLRLCKGCLLAGAGLLAGLAAGWAPPASVPAFLVTAGALGAQAAAAVRARRPKLLSRFLPAFLATLLPTWGLRCGPLPGAAATLAAAAAAALLLRSYRRRGPWRAPCETCPERTAPVPCSGFRAQVRRERAFSRLANRWIARGG